MSMLDRKGRARICSKEKAERSPGVDCGASLTKQEFREECDITAILRRFGQDGIVPISAGQQGIFMDLASLPQFHDAMNLCAAANEAFDALPANVRSRFDNEPGKLVSFISDVSNKEEAVKLGLIKPPDVVVVPEVAKVVAEAPKAPTVAPAGR